MGSAGIDWIEIPTIAGSRAPHPVIWPHKLFAKYREASLENGINVIRGTKGGAREFWEAIATTDSVKKHPNIAKERMGQDHPVRDAR